MSDFVLPIDEHPRLPRKRDYGIALVGAGGIVNYAHLPAYRQAGFNVVGITDLHREKAEQTAKAHGIPRVYDNLEELLGDPKVAIVDVAVFPQQQLRIVEQAAAAGKHLLCQKPLSDKYAEAVRAVDAARRAGVKLAVNQQMRWSPGIRCARQLLDRGWVGDAVYATIQIHVHTDWSLWPWMYEGERLEVLYHSIHHMDSLRYLMGMPRRVYSTGWHSPDENTRAETKTLTVWEYDEQKRVLVDDNHGVWPDDRYAIFRVEGTEGLIHGTVGLLYDYPKGRPDTLEAICRSQNGGNRAEANLTRMWIPDAFVGPMASLMCAIEEGGEPETSGADNLKTLQLVFAAYRSMKEHRCVTPEEIIADAL